MRKTPILFYIFIFLVVSSIFLIYHIYHYSTIEYVDIRVTDKERVTVGSGDSVSSKYLVYTTDEVFENTDNILFMKFNSSDIYGVLDEGDCYTLKVNGIRIPLFSTYRNILSIEDFIQR